MILADSTPVTAHAFLDVAFVSVAPNMSKPDPRTGSETITINHEAEFSTRTVNDRTHNLPGTLTYLYTMIYKLYE